MRRELTNVHVPLVVLSLSASLHVFKPPAPSSVPTPSHTVNTVDLAPRKANKLQGCKHQEDRAGRTGERRTT
jgi:hypothetical protein